MEQTRVAETVRKHELVKRLPMNERETESTEGKWKARRQEKRFAKKTEEI